MTSLEEQFRAICAKGQAFQDLVNGTATAVLEQTLPEPKPCEMKFGEIGAVDYLCETPTLIRVTTACVHEHLQVEMLCTECIENTTLDRSTWCEHCEPIEGDTCKLSVISMEVIT